MAKIFCDTSTALWVWNKYSTFSLHLLPSHVDVFVIIQVQNIVECKSYFWKITNSIPTLNLVEFWLWRRLWKQSGVESLVHIEWRQILKVTACDDCKQCYTEMIFLSQSLKYLKFKRKKNVIIVIFLKYYGLIIQDKLHEKLLPQWNFPL